MTLGLESPLPLRLNFLVLGLINNGKEGKTTVKSRTVDVGSFGSPLQSRDIRLVVEKISGIDTFVSSFRPSYLISRHHGDGWNESIVFPENSRRDWS